MGGGGVTLATLRAGGGFGAENYDKFSGASAIGSDQYYGTGGGGGRSGGGGSPPSLLDAAREAAPVVGARVSGPSPPDAHNNAVPLRLERHPLGS